MKNLKKTGVLLLLCLATVSCLQKKKEKAPETAEIDREKIETSLNEKEKIEKAVHTLRKAIVEPEEALLDSITADKLTYGHSSGLIQDKAEFMDDLLNGAFDFIDVTFPDQTIHISGNTAVVRHIFSAEATNEGQAVDIRIGNMLVYEKQDGKWKLLARQAYKL